MGASSFHLWWELPASGVVEVSAVLEVVVAPAVDELFFWAVQASFAPGGGGGHLGLQWGADGGRLRSVNWGGYDRRGTELGGTTSALPSSTRNANTRDYPWVEGRPYRLRIWQPAAGAWRGDVTDATGVVTVVRDLHAGGDHLTDPVVWSEVFAPCPHPSVTVRWSELSGRTGDGRDVGASAVRTTYQPVEQGGCPNTSSILEEDGLAVRQVTATERTTPGGVRLPLNLGGWRPPAR